MTADQYFACGNVVKTADQRNETGFCTSGRTDDADCFTGVDVEIDILQYWFLAVLFIGKVYMMKSDASVRHFHDRIFRIGKVTFLV